MHCKKAEKGISEHAQRGFSVRLSEKGRNLAAQKQKKKVVMIEI